MEIRGIAILAILVSCCHISQQEDMVSGYCGDLPLFTIPPDLIITTHSNNLSSVLLNDSSQFSFSASIEIKGNRYGLIGRTKIIQPKAVYANAGESRIIWQCGEYEVTLSFIAPSKNYGCYPVNYLLSQVKDRNGDKCMSSLMIEIDPGALLSDCIHYGFLPTNDKYSSLFFLAYSSKDLVQLWGKIVLPYWKKNYSDSVLDLVNSKDILSPASGSVGLRLMKAKLNLSKTKHGELICVTYPYVNRMTQMSNLIDTLALYGEKELLEGIMNPLLFYSESELWNAPYCPPDIGAYPMIMHRISDDEDYVWVTNKAIETILIIDSLAHNRNYSRKHKVILNKWREFVE